MSKINILEPKVFNRIAAGEVVDKPASVVKELVENAIDANSTDIKIEIEDGGTRIIKVSDNGDGMIPEDLPKAFMPHSTSKIKTVHDLDKIGTLGFRGEALSSIANVSKVNVISKTNDAETGGSITINGGDLMSQSEKGCPNGTFVTVSGLFYNVPARAKFLRTVRKEELEITNLVSRFILSNPKIRFVYLSNGKEIFRSTGNTLKESIYSVYKKNVLEEIIPVSYDGVIKINGYVSKPTHCKNNRTYQTLIINGRYVINYLVSSAVLAAFDTYTMKGRFPLYVLNIEMPLDKLDVNVHPNKLDVKFEDSQNIYGIIYGCVSKALSAESNILKADRSADTKTYRADYIPVKTRLERKDGESYKIYDNYSDIEEKKPVNISSEVTARKPSVYKDTSTYNILELKQQNIIEKNNEQNESNKTEGLKIKSSIFDMTSEYDLSLMKIKGVVFNTFIIIEENDTLFLIDQHAAHERILYDKIKKQVGEAKILKQGLMHPFILNINHQESEFIDENIDNIINLGFEIEYFGKNTYKVSSVPSMLKKIDLEKFFESILNDLSRFRMNNKSQLIDEQLIMMSCKHAVKAGDKLSENEIKRIFSDIKSNKTKLLCPHGRPIVVELSKKEIEKWFKRIV